MRTLLLDLRYAVRNLRNARGFALVAAVTLAIGIGANTAIFSIIDTILLRPLPYRDPSQLVRLNETESAPGRYPFARKVAPVSGSAHVVAAIRDAVRSVIRCDGAGAARAGADRFQPAALQRSLDG